MSELPTGRWWVALVCFERTGKPQDILPDHALGACGWMFTSGQNEDEARSFIERDIAHHGLHVVEFDRLTEIFEVGDIDPFDEHLAANVRAFEEGHRTAWGTINVYLGEGEA